MTKIDMKIIHLRCHQNLPGANELKSHNEHICWDRYQTVYWSDFAGWSYKKTSKIYLFVTKYFHILKYISHPLTRGLFSLVSFMNQLTWEGQKCTRHQYFCFQNHKVILSLSQHCFRSWLRFTYNMRVVHIENYVIQYYSALSIYIYIYIW